MPRFLFWNLAKSANEEIIARIALSNRADILIFAECEIPPSHLLQRLNHKAPDYEYAPGQCKALKFFTKFDRKFLRPSYESHRVSLRRLTLPGRSELTVVSAHLPSKLHSSDSSKVFGCVELNRIIEEQEKLFGHRRTVVIADLNANPFEDGVSACAGLHAVMTRAIAQGRTRTVQSKEYSFFYNPMWSHFGDRQNSPSGTYYYNKADYLTYFWNIFDQVLLRPALLNGFKEDGIRILEEVDGVSLLDDRGRPDKLVVSDHLPVLLELEF